MRLIAGLPASVSKALLQGADVKDLGDNGSSANESVPNSLPVEATCELGQARAVTPDSAVRGHQFVGVLVGDDRATPATATTASAVVILMTRLVTGTIPCANRSRTGHRRCGRWRGVRRASEP